MSDIIVTTKMPVLALRGMTVFPEQTVHFDIGRIKSALALEEAMKKTMTAGIPKRTSIWRRGCSLKKLAMVTRTLAPRI